MKSISYVAVMILFAVFVAILSALAIVEPIVVTGKPAYVILIRHAEKPETGEELSARGKERAAALAPFFLERPEITRFGKPTAIYAERPKKATSSVRPMDTVAPLAKAIDRQVIDKFTRVEIEPMAKEILTQPAYSGKMVLVCWEHSMIPPLAKALGCTTAPDKWHGKAFDRLWVLSYHPDGSVTFEDLPQRLLFGDSKD